MSEPAVTNRAAAHAAGRRPRAIVHCGHFGEIDGKTANALVRQSERYEIVAIIDQSHAGRDAGAVLGDRPLVPRSNRPAPNRRARVELRARTEPT